MQFCHVQVEARLRQEANWLFTTIGESSRALADAAGRTRHAHELDMAERRSRSPAPYADPDDYFNMVAGSGFSRPSRR